MKLEIAMLVGPESKQFLIDLTKQLDRMEALKGSDVKAPETTKAPEAAEAEDDEDFAEKKPAKGKKAAAKSFDEDEEESDEASEAAEDDEDDEDFAEKKPAKGKKAAKSFDEDEEESDEDAEEEKPAKAKAAKKKKVTADDVNDACKAYAKKHSREAVLKILKKKFKTETISELKPEQYEEVIAALALDEDDEE